MVVVELPPLPATYTARIEASFALPEAPPPYEYVLVSEGETLPQGVPVRLASGEPAPANPIRLLLDRLGFSLRPPFLKIWSEKMPVTGSSDGSGLGDGSPAPVPPGDPIPVGGGGGPTGG